MKKQTAVNFLTKELINNSENDYSFAQAHKTITIDLDSFYELIEKSLLIEKEQVIYSYREGRTDQQSGIKKWYNRSALGFYNETFEL
jgi:hypothetical protein